MIAALWFSLALGGETLSIDIVGLPSDSGIVYCTLYDGPEKWLEDGGHLIKVQTTPKDGKALCSFPDVSKGTYGVSFLHDLNGNKDMDFNMFGMPKEPWGVSRDGPARMSPPTFESCAFPFPGPVPKATAR